MSEDKVGLFSETTCRFIDKCKTNSEFLLILIRSALSSLILISLISHTIAQK